MGYLGRSLPALLLSGITFSYGLWLLQVAKELCPLYRCDVGELRVGI